MARWTMTAILGAAAATLAGSSTGNATSRCIAGFDRTADYFPDKIAVEDAVNFTVEYRRSYKVVTVGARSATVRQAQGRPEHSRGAKASAERYVLFQCGTPAPPMDGALAGAQAIPVPITSLFASSSTHLPPLADLDRLDVLTGVARRDVVGGELTARVTRPLLEFAPMSVVDAELVVSSRPSLLMTAGAPGAAVAAIRAAGVPVVTNVEWLEATALGRAEWMKYIALFLNEERKAQAAYTALKGRYRASSSRASMQPQRTRPLVMTGRSTRGTFTIAGGRSYVAALIADAGGRYVWADNPAAGSTTVDLESQLARAANADVWINGGGWASRAAMLADEPRYAEFKAFQRGQVWVYERRQTATGGNDYWSRGVSRPDLVLADLIKIFHPSLMADHAFEWYMPVPGSDTGSDPHVLRR